MRLAFPIDESGKYDFSRGVEIADHEEVPDGYAIPDWDKESKYKTTGEEMTQEEIDAIQTPSNPPLSLEEQITVLKLRLAMAEQSAAETSLTLQQMLELLIDSEVI